MKCAICGEEGGSAKQELWGPEFAHSTCVIAFKQGQIARQEILEQQLSAALAACKVKDELFEKIACLGNGNSIGNDLGKDALAVQPDDSALKAWLGEPVAWMRYNTQGELLIATKKPSWDESVWPPLYSPKGLK